MRLYIFLTQLIRGVGGGHIYTLSKMRYLRKVGYDVNLVHANDLKDELKIEELRPYFENYDEHFLYPIYFFSKDVIDGVCNSFIHRYCKEKCYEKIIIEAHDICMSTWGEEISKRLKAKHFIYILGENCKLPTASLADFYRFKIERSELVGIAPDSVENLMSDWCHVEDARSRCLRAYSPNPIDDIEYDTSYFPSADYTIGSIGRIEKCFLLPALRVVRSFAEQHKDKKINILIIGGEIDSDRNRRKIEDLFANISNVFVHITGIIYPLPLKLLKLPDVFLSTSGSCKASADIGKPTISFDIHDGLPIGVLNWTTENFIERNDPFIPDLFSLLNDVLVKKIYTDIEIPYDIEEGKNISYRDHIDYIDNSSNLCDYFDIKSATLSSKDNIKIFLIKRFGIQGSIRLLTIIGRIKTLLMHIF